MDGASLINRLSSVKDILLGNTLFAPEVYTAEIVVFNLLLSVVLAVAIAYTYKAVHKGVSYSQSYVYSIVIVSMVVALAMMVIGNDITRAFALLGTFTIIRYRTAVKDPKDTAFIFMALVMGLATGSSNYSIALIGTAIFIVTALFLDRIDFGALAKLDHVLYVTLDPEKTTEKELKKHLRSGFKKTDLLNVSFSKNDKKLLLTYNVQISPEEAENKVISTVNDIKGVEDVELMTATNVVEF